MSLDFAILDTDGSPKEQVSIGVDDHSRLMTHAAVGSEGLLLRVYDYYSDDEFSVDELEALIKDAFRLRARLSDGRLVTFLDALIKLATHAQSTHQPVIVIAD